MAADRKPPEPKKFKELDSDKRQHSGARFSPCGRYLFAGDFLGNLLRWDATTDDYTFLPLLGEHTAWVQALAFAPAGGLVFSGDSHGRLNAWRYDEKEPRLVWSHPEAHAGWLRAIAVSPDGSRLVTCGRDQMIRLWEATSGKLLSTLGPLGDDLYTLAYHPDGKSFVCGDAKGVVKLWDASSGKELRTFDAHSMFAMMRLQDVGGVRTLTFHPSGETLAVGGTTPANGGNVQGAPTVILFEVSTGKERRRWKLGESGDVYADDVAWDPRGHWIVATSGNPGNGKFLFVRPDEDKPFFEQKVPNCLAVSLHPQGQRLAVTTINTGSNGNGRGKAMGMDYPSNWSPIFLYDLPAPGETSVAKST